jgi:circadian clock protein KaiB
VTGQPPGGGAEYVLKLYVTGGTPRTARAIAHLHRIRDELLAGRCEILIVDVLDQPQAADEDRILVTPTLIRQLPLPPRRVLGDLSDTAQVLAWLDLQPAPPAALPAGPGQPGQPSGQP